MKPVTFVHPTDLHITAPGTEDHRLYTDTSAP